MKQNEKEEFTLTSIIKLTYKEESMHCFQN